MSNGACLARTYPILAQQITAPRSELVVLDPTGSQSVALGRGAFVYGAVWSPDGWSIAFRRRPITDFASAPTEIGLLVPNVAREEAVLLADEDPTFDGIYRRAPDGPTWSMDGRELAFASLREADHYRVWVMARSGGQIRLLLPELEGVPHFYPRWSPRDPARVAYIAEEGGVEDLWVADLNSGRRQRVTSGEFEKLESPRWSPEGERLAFSALARNRPTEQGDRYDVYVVDLASAEKQRISMDAGSNVDPAWAPDGASLLVSSTREGEAAGPLRALNLWRLWLEGGRAPERLTAGGSSTIGADWYGASDCSGR